MSNFVCKTCKALLGVGQVYCLNCGTPIVESVDDGPETVVRPKQLAKVSAFSVRATVAGIAAALLIVVVVIGGLYALAKYDDERSKRTRDMEDQVREANRMLANAANAAKTQIPQSPTAAPRKVTATPELDPSGNKPTANVPANRPPKFQTAPPNATAQCNDQSFWFGVIPGVACNDKGGVMQWYVRGFDTTRQPRAICGNGGMSYWDGPAVFTCGGGSVRWWYYR